MPVAVIFSPSDCQPLVGLGARWQVTEGERSEGTPNTVGSNRSWSSPAIRPPVCRPSPCAHA